MKTKIYNNLIFSLLFVCSIVYVAIPVFAQDDNGGAPPPITEATTEDIDEFADPTREEEEPAVDQEPAEEEEAAEEDDFEVCEEDALEYARSLAKSTLSGFPLLSLLANSITNSITTVTLNIVGDDGLYHDLTYEEGDKLYCTDKDDILNSLANAGPLSRDNVSLAGNHLTVTIPEASGDGTPSATQGSIPTTQGAASGSVRRDSATESIRKGDPATLHLYSSIFGIKTIKTTNTNQKEVSGLIQTIFTRFFSVIFTISGILMVVMLAVHGTQMIYAEFTGNVPGFSDAKKRVKAAAIGTIILLLSWIILDFIDPDLLRPKLFTTITQLREVGQGNSLVTNNLTVPDNAIDYNKNTGDLTIKACPEIEDNFKLQVESVRKSLQHGKHAGPLPQYHYQILYSNFGDEEVKVYEEGRADRTFDELRNLPGGGNSFVGVIECTRSKTIEAKIPYSDNIAVFPIVSIRVKETADDPGEIAKFWRGTPWRRKSEFKTSDLAKEILVLDNFFTLTVKRHSTTSDALYITASYQPDTDLTKVFNIRQPVSHVAVSFAIRGIGGDASIFEYADPETKLTEEGCETKSFASYIHEKHNGKQRILCAESNSKGFSVTPKLNVTSGVGRDATTNSFDGKKACFKFIRDANAAITDAEQTNC